jgi:hypothetical protein
MLIEHITDLRFTPSFRGNQFFDEYKVILCEFMVLKHTLFKLILLDEMVKQILGGVLVL